MNRQGDDGDRQAESRRILKGVSREDGDRDLASRSVDYLAARDRDQHDPIEVWGTRIGRWAGIATVGGMLLILARYLGLI